MNWEIAIVLLTLLAMLASFVYERIPTELTALVGLSFLLLTGILGTPDALAAFSNAAPITVGAMFIVSAALEKSGAIQSVAQRLQAFPNARVSIVLPLLILAVASVSAFINNTPVVVIFLPVVLSIAKQLRIPPSKLLIPLSFASIFGGNCTLVGTSTNIVISSVAESQGLAPFSLFELAWVGLPLLAAGTLYLCTIGYRMLPHRETVSSILSEDQRREYIIEAFLGEDSPLHHKSLASIPHFHSSGLRPLEIIRHGVALRDDPNQVPLQLGDRVLIAASPRALAQAPKGDALAAFIEQCGMEQIASVEGGFVEVALRSETNLAGHTPASLNFRQRYRLAPVAIHRNGRNLSENVAQMPLKGGDILLLLGSREAIAKLRQEPDFVVIDETPIEPPAPSRYRNLTLLAIAGMIAASAAGLIPIAGAAIIASTFLILAGCLTPQDAYRAIQWPILFLIFAMLGVGKALETSGATALLANTLVHATQSFVAEPWRPLALLAAIYLVTTILTEILSNNAAAVLMATLAIGSAQTLGVDPKPFLVAVAIAASASFATPIGYQTNTYVYGIGGYRFTDFLKIGIPLNLVAFLVAVLVIPLIWSF